MKIAIIRGDFASPWEMQNLKFLKKGNDLTLFTGLKPVANLKETSWLKTVKLPSPVDLNFGKINHLLMSMINRVFVDGHLLFGLEKALTGFDIAFCAETYYSFTQQCLSAKSRRTIKKVVSICYENIPFNNQGIWGREAYKRKAINKVDAFLAVTEKAKEVLIIEGCDPKKIVRATPGVDLKHFRPADIKPKNTGIKLLIVSRLVEEKGIAELVSIFLRLCKKYPSLLLTVVGEGPLEKKLRREGITHLPKVPYDQMPSIYQQHDIFIHYPKGSKTWQEQFGFVLAEAMACGLPVVGLDRGSVKEVVGPGGLVVPANKYYSSLESLIKNNAKRLQLGKIALQFARKTYDAKKYARKLEKIFQSA